MALRINAISVGAVEYLLRGCGCDREKERALDLDRDPALHADHQHGPERGRELGADGYFADAIERGEPAGVWWGEGMAALRIDARAGDVARDDEVRAIFGQGRRPGPLGPNGEADWIGSKPRQYPGAQERLDKLVATEPGEVSGERLRELEVQAAASGRKAVGYYDFTFSPAKSVSVYYAALLAAGDVEGAGEVREAHDQAVRDALSYAEAHVAWTRVGDHGRNADGDRVGEFVQATGLSAVLFSHSTSREDEPQLHTHAGVLNRVGVVGPDGEVKIGALDGRGFRALKEAFEAAYMRAVEDNLHTSRGVVFETRPDGKAREIVGVDPELMAQASTRRSQILDRVEELIAGYRDRHGREPDQAARSRLAEVAALGTRKAKDGVAGPAAVAAWGQQRLEWCLDVLDQVESAALSSGLAERLDREPGQDPGGDRGHGREPGGHQVGREVGRGHEVGVEFGGRRIGMATGPDPVAGRGESVATGPERVAALKERVAAATAAGVADVQARYSTWTLGNVAAAIDHHLPTTRALGLAGGAERAVYVEALARRAVAPAAGHDVVQLTGHEPVAVPDALLRESDGRPRFRPHLDERYATAAHLAREEAVLARAHATGAATIDQPAAATLSGRLDAAGLSPDQRDAVLGIMGSGRAADVLIGPAGTGKSRTVAALGEAWAAAHGGRVFGLATSQIATRNLAEDGLYALNTTQFLGAVEPDAAGVVRERLRPGDLVVIDEAGMASLDHMDRITAAAARAVGAKVLYAGDPDQLGSPEAGGLFAVLAERVDPGARHELDQVHRLRHGWERDASVRLRAGDASVFDAYDARGRIEHGTLEEMTHLGVRSYVTDRLAGRTAVLVAGTNEAAAQLSRQVRQELADLGVVTTEALARDQNGNRVGLGDLVQARQNDYRLRVDPGPPGAGGAPGRADPVTNRQLYTVAGIGPDNTLYVRDEHGAVAHLPEHYVRDHVALGYAGTVHSVQSLSVHASYELADPTATRESHYVALTRGAELNVALLVTDREPDEHDPERMAALKRERFTEIVERSGVDRAGTIVREAYQAAAGSVASVAARIEIEGRLAARARHDATLDRLVVDGALDGGELARLRGEGERPDRDRLERALLAAELGGHDPDQLLETAVRERELHTATSVGDVLRHRVRGAASYTTPDRDRAGSWADVVARDAAPAVGAPGEAGAYLGALAVEADARQAAIGARVAEQAPEWAVALLGPVPDPQHEPEGRLEWERAAAVIGAAREVLGVPDEQTSLGATPSPERVLAHDLWTRAQAEVTTEPDPAARDWRAARDAELYTAREAWARTTEHAPAWVADELAETHRLVREYDAEGVREAVRATQAAPGSREALEHAEAAARWRAFGEHHAERVVDLEQAHQTRASWWDEHAGLRHADAAAAAELARRGLPFDRGTEQPTTEPEPAPAAEPDLERDLEPGREVVEGPAPGVDAPEPQPVEPGDRSWVWDRFLEQLRAEHRERLDPGRELDGEALAHARAAEIRNERTRQPTQDDPGREQPDHVASATPEPVVEPAVETAVEPEHAAEAVVEPDVATPVPEPDHVEAQSLVDPEPVADLQAAPEPLVEREPARKDGGLEEASARLREAVRTDEEARQLEQGAREAAEQRAAREQQAAEQRALVDARDLEPDGPGLDGPQLESGLEIEQREREQQREQELWLDDGLEL